MDSEKLKPCYLCLFLTIALGVGAGNLLADWIELQAANAALIEITNRLTGKKSKPFNKRTPATKPPISYADKKERLDKFRTETEICLFWENAVRKEPTKTNKMYRDKACRK